MGTLAHFGIKGMKWGVRRSDAQLTKANSGSKPGGITPRSGESEDAARARTTLATIKKSKSRTSVSDADLNHLVNRLNMEKRYTEISKSSSFDKSHAKVKTLLNVGDTMNKAISFYNSPAGKLITAKLFTKAAVKVGKHAKP